MFGHIGHIGHIGYAVTGHSI